MGFSAIENARLFGYIKDVVEWVLKESVKCINTGKNFFLH